MKQPASREVCYNNSELQVVAPAATWKKIQWKAVKNWMFLTRYIKSIFILTSLIGFSLISSQEFYIIWAFWRCLEHLDTHFLFISHWSLKNWILWCEIQAILLKCQGGTFSLQYSGNIYFSFSSAACCTSQKVGGHWWQQYLRFVENICHRTKHLWGTEWLWRHRHWQACACNSR